jgi:hypothetical protein
VQVKSWFGLKPESFAPVLVKRRLFRSGLQLKAFVLSSAQLAPLALSDVSVYYNSTELAGDSRVVASVDPADGGCFYITPVRALTRCCALDELGLRD